MAHHDAVALRWELPQQVCAAYSTIADGDQREREARHAWLASHGIRRCIVPRQIHGTRIVQADAPADDLAIADGVVTSDPQIALGAYGADCPGLVLLAADAHGVAHCGWRGVAGGIVGGLVAAMRTVSGQSPGQWHAFIGPGISGTQYEVDAPVLTARTWPATAVRPGRTGRAWLDVPEAIAADLVTAGVTQVVRSGICTSSDPRLWSYRQRGAGQVQLLAVWRAT
jgi:YfiH family protein